MSRSKEGIEKQRQDRQAAEPTQGSATPNFTEQTRASGQTDYGWGRESRREFPRRSTSYREQNQNLSQTQGYQRDYGRTGSDYETRREGLRRERGEWRESSRNVYPRNLSERYQDRWQRDEEERRRYRAYEQSLDMQRDPYRRHESRATAYQDRFSGREYPRNLDIEDRDQEGRGRSYRARDYDRERDYRSERDLYEDPYDRESFSGRFGDYEPETKWEGYGVPYNTMEDRPEYWRQDYGRSYLRCGDVMTRDVTTCSPQTPLREVAERMEDEDVGSIPVVDNGRLLGIVTDRDIVCRVLAEGRDSRSATAADAMSQDLVIATREESVVDAIQKMGENQVRRLPVVDVNGRLRGIIALADIALEAERDRELANALEQISQPTPFTARRR